MKQKVYVLIWYDYEGNEYEECYPDYNEAETNAKNLASEAGLVGYHIEERKINSEELG